MATPSLALIPTGFKAGKLYSVLPEDGTGDFDVTRATTATRVNEQGLIESMAINVPRLDYTDGGCPVLLTEPQSTNLSLYSEDFSNAVWSLTRGTITPNLGIAPDGLQTADKFTATDDDARLIQSISSADIRTQSIYVKSAQASDVAGQIDFSGLNIVTFTANQEWQRVESTLDNVAFNSTRLRITNSGDELYIWGGQLEDLSYATSYIPTNGWIETRVKDEVSKSGLSSEINSVEGVLFFEGSALTEDGTNRYIYLGDGTSTNRVVIRYSTIENDIRALISVGGSSWSEGHIVADATLNAKIALKWKQNDFALWVDGVEVLTTTSFNSFGSGVLNTLNFSYSGVEFYGNCKQLQVYKTALTDAELISLTS